MRHLKIAMHEIMASRWRWVVIIALLILAVSGPTGTLILYKQSQAALRNSQDALTRARNNRKAVQFVLCRDVNQLRQINNRDRQTFIIAIRQQNHALKVIRDPALRGLIKSSLARNKIELRIRPHLKPAKCRKLAGPPEKVSKP